MNPRGHTIGIVGEIRGDRAEIIEETHRAEPLDLRKSLSVRKESQRRQAKH